MIKNLREPKIHVAGVHMAIFDVGATVLGGYAVAKVMDWSPFKTIPAMFVLGHLAHNSSGVETPLSTKINETFTGVQEPFGRAKLEDPDKISINNSNEPVKKNEVRFSTF